MSEQALTSPAVFSSPSRGVWRHSLLFALLAATAVSVLITSALLYLGIDRVVSQQFAHLRSERLANAERLVRDGMRRELDALGNLGDLLGNDAELNNATYYHLYLDGEVEHPVAAVRRIAEGFHLDAVRLWDTGGRLIAAAPAAQELPISPPTDPEQALARVVWMDGQPWLTAQQPLARAGNSMAVLFIGRPLTGVLANIFPAGGEVSVRIARPDQPAQGLRVALDGVAGQPVWLDVAVEDSAGRALARVKRLLLWLMPTSVALLMFLLGLTLHRQLRPLSELTHAVARVGRGELTPVAARSGEDEIARLVRAYNDMTADLARLRDVERRLHQQERLSAIGRMAARVAHDINNPLSVVRGVAELMEKQSERAADAQAKADAGLILHHIQRCQRTVEQLLAYGRPVRLVAERHDLNRLCAEMTARWQSAHPETNLSFVPTAAPLPVEVDALQLERVMDNLLDNARAAGAPVWVTLAVCEGAGRWAEIRVRDAGPGFSAEARSHLFEPFYTTRRGGSGLGLASCLAIVEAHGGEMALGDGPGGEVVVRLPALSDSL